MDDRAASLFSVRDKVILVTGATSGLGRHAARTFARAGAKVVAVGRRQARLDELAPEAPGVLCIACDLGDDAELERLVATAESRLGPVEVLVNNAGFAADARGQDETREQIERTLAINLLAPFRLAQHVYPGMAAGSGGSIINVTSIVAEVGIGRIPQASYAASKGGLWALTRELAAQWARDGVRVNAIAPGFFESEMSSGIVANERLNAYIMRNSPIERLGMPADFDGALLYLASEASSFVTGQRITVDGGWTAR